MHIPDGFINAPTALTTGAVSAGGVAYALRSARATLDDRRIPLVGVTSAFVFAVQMLNFPVGLGTSGHLIGGALAAILLGPWMAVLVLSVVLLVQGLFFADGGMTAIGANISLMGIVAGFGGYYLFRSLASVLPRGRGGYLAATAVTAWASVVLASVLCSFYLLANGFPGQVLPVMVGLHALIGLGEAAITTAVVAAVVATRPDLVATADLLGAEVSAGRRGRNAAGLVVAGLGVALFCGAVLSSFAASAPDGLESAVLTEVAGGDEDRLGELAGDPAYDAAPLPDYQITPLSGAIGVAVCFAVGAGVMALFRSRGAGPRKGAGRGRERVA